MSNSFEIRKATKEDRKKIKELIALYPETLVQDDLPRSNSFFVATEKGTIVGCAALQRYSKRLAEVRSLAVETKLAKNGMGSALVEACVKEAERLGIYQVLSITGHPGMFERQGFSAFKEEKLALIKNLQPGRKGE